MLPLHIVGTDNTSTSHNKTIEINAYVSITAASYLFKLRTEKGHRVDLLWFTDGRHGDVGVVPVEGRSCTFACIMQ
jgi:hypothetical protein